MKPKNSEAFNTKNNTATIDHQKEKFIQKNNRKSLSSINCIILGDSPYQQLTPLTRTLYLKTLCKSDLNTPGRI